VLRAYELTEEVWRTTERRWKDAIEQETGCGSTKLRRVHDGAYVAVVEGFRGPITPEEYARIMIALERGRENQELEMLRIQQPALMRIVRVWTKKLAGDGKLRQEVKGLVARMRRA
jgi:hypothetical protein